MTLRPLYRVTYADGSRRDVTASNAPSALRTARRAASSTGRTGKARRPVRAELVGQLGDGGAASVIPDGGQVGGSS
jgi:hypothetical protein